MKKIKKVSKLVVSFFILCITITNTLNAAPYVHATSYVLMEATSARVVSQHNAHKRIFPAATTMILTSLLAYENIGLDDIIIAGNEVTMLPPTSGRNGHDIGEAILGQNLIRGMLIGAGNDTALITAKEIARRVSGNNNIGFASAIQIFTTLMNERAVQLGAYNSNFINPHGYHHDSHFSTAFDMAKIAQYAINISFIAEVAASPSFSGPMAGDNPPANISSVTRTWHSPNELIRYGASFYPYARGFRTGFTNQAGESLVATANQNGVSLIAVTFDSAIIDNAPTRWQNSINLFEYGFANYAFRYFQSQNEILGQLKIYNPVLGGSDTLSFYSNINGRYFLSQEELSRLNIDINISQNFIAYNENELLLQPPIEQGDIIGNISYILDDAVIFSAELLAYSSVSLRSTATDIDYYMAWIQNVFFSASSIPYWVAAFCVFVLLIVLLNITKNSLKKKQNKYKMKF